VVIKLNTQVVDYKDDTVFLLTENIRNQNLIWAAGVTAKVLKEYLQTVMVVENE
jgi:NADH dehydrogenase